MGIVRSTLDFDLLRFIFNPPADMRKGWAAQFIQIPKRDRRDGVTTQVRNSPWTRFFNGITCHQNHIGRSLPAAV